MDIQPLTAHINTAKMATFTLVVGKSNGSKLTWPIWIKELLLLKVAALATSVMKTGSILKIQTQTMTVTTTMVVMTVPMMVMMATIAVMTATIVVTMEIATKLLKLLSKMLNKLLLMLKIFLEMLKVLLPAFAPSRLTSM